MTDNGDRQPWLVKLARADELIGRLYIEIDGFVRSEQVGFRVEYQAEPGVHIVRFVQRAPVPARFSAVVGDVVHNLRSALDTVAWNLVGGADSNLTPGKQRQVQFPCYEAAEDFNARRAQRLPGVSEAVVDAIRYLQPFWLIDQVGETDPVARRTNIEVHPLWVLVDLSNTDKHRSLHLGAWYMALEHVSYPAGVDLRYFRKTAVPRHDGEEIGRWVVTVGPTDAPVNVGGSLALALERDLRANADVAVVDRLKGLRDWVAYAISFIGQGAALGR